MGAFPEFLEPSIAFEVFVEKLTLVFHLVNILCTLSKRLVVGFYSTAIGFNLIRKPSVVQKVFCGHIPICSSILSVDKTDHSAFEIYLYSPLAVFVWGLVAKIHLVSPPPPQPISFQNNHWILSSGFVPKDFPLGVWKVSKVLGIFIFVWPERFLPDAACPASLPALTFKRLFTCFLWLLFIEFLSPRDPLLPFKDLFKKVSFGRQQGG